MFLDDPVGNMEKFVQPVRSTGINSQDEEPASLLEIWDPIQTRDGNVKTVEISQKVYKVMSGTRQQYGRIPDDRMVRSTATTKSCFRSFANPIERDMLMCSGSGAARSLVNRECRRLRPSGGTPCPRAVIMADSAACSAVDGNPRPCQRRTIDHLRKNQGTTPRPTLDVEMRGPIALDMRGHPLTPAVQAGVVAGTDPGGRSVEIVELRRERWQGSSRRLVGRQALALDLGIVVLVVRGRIVDEGHGQGMAFLVGDGGGRCWIDCFGPQGEYHVRLCTVLYVLRIVCGLSLRGNVSATEGTSEWESSTALLLPAFAILQPRAA
jgi:hypothetical protein